MGDEIDFDHLVADAEQEGQQLADAVQEQQQLDADDFMDNMEAQRAEEELEVYSDERCENPFTMASTDCDVLRALYQSKWYREADLPTWWGLEVNDQDRVVTLLLGANNFQGPIPSELGKLAALKHIHLNGNNLSGPIPPELGNLSALMILSLENNGLSGTIPTELGELIALEKLTLQDNNLSGSIPPVLGALTNLKTLALSANKLTGSIPPVLGALTNLKTLALSANKLTGSIPPELGNLAALEELDLARNILVGSIPPVLGILAALRNLNLCHNQLSGPIPKQLGAVTKLEFLWLSNNALTGTIPKQLGALTKLKILWLNHNELTGSLPPELGNLAALKELYLGENQLSGAIPKQLGALHKLKSLRLDNNQLTAFWDHSASCDEQQQGCAGISMPKEELDQMLDLLSGKRDLDVDFDENPWKEPPEAVVRKGMQAVREYFDDLFVEGVTVHRNMIKVVLVGQEGAGKTSLRQSIKNRIPTPTSGPEESTVQIDVEDIQMEQDGVSLRVYDCAGQVAYTGLLQMFLSPRAVSVLVCNTGAFGLRDDSANDRSQLEQDLSKLQELRVCDWLRSLSFRVPDNDVVVVATKCDLAGGMAASLAMRMENAVRMWLENWRNSEMTAVRVEDGVSLTSCVPILAQDEKRGADLRKRKRSEESGWACDWREDMRDDSPPSLLDRVMFNSKGDLRGAAMVLPRSWNIALQVLEALGSGRDPVESVHQMQLSGVEGQGGGQRPSLARVKQHKEIEGLTLTDLSGKWSAAVEALQREGVEIFNADHALEGALSIREYEGSLVRHETYVFLDVTWLAKILKPLLNHRDVENCCGNVSLGDTGITLSNDEHIDSWKRFKETGVLKPGLAGVLWPDGLCDYVLPTLASLGLAHSLDGDSVVLVRLGKERPRGVGKELDDFRRDNTAVLCATWKIFLGVPPGAIEKVLTRCCSIGALRTFWRFGVLIQGGLGGVSAVKTFAMLIEYSHEKTEVDMKVYGDIGNAAPWAALSFGVSVVRAMCSEFPGLRWRASITCPQHDQNMPISKKAVRPGDKLLLGESCSLCSPETGGLGAAATDLLELVDVTQSKGEIFRNVKRRFVELQLKEEVEGFLSPVRASGGKGVEEGVKAAKHKDDTGISGEVAKLQRMVENLQHQLGQQHHDMRGWLGVVDKHLEAIVDADAGAVKTRDFLVAMLMAVRLEGFDTPRQACVLPPWKFAKVRGLSEDEQSPKVWLKRLDEWREEGFKEGKGFFKKRKRLFLICAHTHRLVPCGPNGQGYDIQQLRTWFHMSVSVATFALQVACSTLTAMALAPASGVGAAVEIAVSTSMRNFESLLRDELEALTISDDGAAVEVDAEPQAAQLEGGAYASLREFIHGVEDTARLEMVKAERGRRASSSSEFVFFSQMMVQVQRRNGDAAVQWVLKGHEDAWHDAMKSAPSA